MRKITMPDGKVYEFTEEEFFGRSNMYDTRNKVRPKQMSFVNHRDGSRTVVFNNEKKEDVIRRIVRRTYESD